MANANFSIRVPGCPGISMDREARIVDSNGFKCVVKDGIFPYKSPFTGNQLDVPYIAAMLSVGYGRPSREIVKIIRRGLTRCQDDETKRRVLILKGFHENDIPDIIGEIPEEREVYSEMIPSAQIVARLDEMDDEVSFLLDSPDVPVSKLTKQVFVQVVSIAAERERILEWLSRRNGNDLEEKELDVSEQCLSENSEIETELADANNEVRKLLEEKSSLENRLRWARKLNNHLLYLLKKNNIGPDREKMKEDCIETDIFQPLTKDFSGESDYPEDF